MNAGTKTGTSCSVAVFKIPRPFGVFFADIRRCGDGVSNCKQFLRRSHFSKTCLHDFFHVIEIRFGLERIVDAVVAGEEELAIVHFWIVAEMRKPGRFHQSVSHERAGGNDGFDDAGLHEVAKNKTHFRNGHRAGSVMTIKQSLSRAMASSTSAASPI